VLYTAVRNDRNARLQKVYLLKVFNDLFSKTVFMRYIPIATKEYCIPKEYRVSPRNASMGRNQSMAKISFDVLLFRNVEKAE
jgi:hypothetical protein